MAFLQICGFETGTDREAGGLFTDINGGSIQSGITRTGGYAYRSNPTAGTGTYNLKGISTAGKSTALSGTTHYLTVHLYIATTASANSAPVVRMGTSSTYTIEVRLNTNSTLEISGATTSSPTDVLSVNTWHTLSIKSVNNGTCELAVGNSAPVTCTGNAVAATDFYVGSLQTNVTYDCYFDDIAISDSGYPGEGEVRILKPNATGNYTSWTDGAGTAPTNVAEVPHDSDTGYITSSTAAQAETEALDSATTGGVTGTIGAVKSVVIVRDEGGVSSLNIRTRSNTTDQDTVATDPGVVYRHLGKLNETDPATSAAWTTNGLDSLEVGVLNNNAVAVRCAAIYAMVWCTGASAALAAGRRSLLGVGV